jgi:hypothetical protein
VYVETFVLLAGAYLAAEATGERAIRKLEPAVTAATPEPEPATPAVEPEGESARGA